MIVPCLNHKGQNPPTTLLGGKTTKRIPLKTSFTVFLVYQTEIGSFFPPTLEKQDYQIFPFMTSSPPPRTLTHNGEKMLEEGMVLHFTLTKENRTKRPKNVLLFRFV